MILWKWLNTLELNIDGSDFHKLIDCDIKELTNEDIELVDHREKNEISEQERESYVKDLSLNRWLKVFI